MTAAQIATVDVLLFLSYTVAPMLGLLASSVGSLAIIYRLDERWLLLLIVAMAFMTQHQILEAQEFFAAGAAALPPVPETFETAANLTLAGATYYALSFARDQHRLAGELERSRDRYTQLVENAPTPILVVRDGEIAYANPMATAFFGVGSPGELSGAELLEFVHAEDRQRVGEELAEAMETGYPIAISETRFVAEERDKRATSMVARISYDGGEALQVILQDVTDRREYERRLDETLQNTNDAVFIVDPEADEILECNERACEMVGYDREELIGMPASEIHPGEMDRLKQFAEAAATGDGARTDALSCRRRDGREVPAEMSGATIEFRGRECLLAVVRDITERRRRERRLEVVDRVLRHNFRNDMNVVIGQAEVLAAELDDGRLAEMADRIRRTASDLMAMSDDLRRVQSTIDRSTDAEDHETDARAHVEAVVERFRGTHPDARIEVDLPPELRVLGTDELQIAFEQVIENAIVHNDDPHPTVRITADRHPAGEEWVELRVTDDGPGLPEQERAVFIEDEEITPLRHGSGIGLWTAVWVVEAFDGEVLIEDAETGGTRVRFRLRRATATAPAPAR